MSRATNEVHSRCFRALRWVLPEQDAAQAIQLRSQFVQQQHELLAPDVFPFEIGHALTRAERQNRLSPPQSLALLADILTTAPDLRPSLPLLQRAMDISSLHRIGVYDGLYVALAEQENCDLITYDQRLVINLQPRGFPVLSIISI